MLGHILQHNPLFHIVQHILLGFFNEFLFSGSVLFHLST